MPSSSVVVIVVAVAAVAFVLPSSSVVVVAVAVVLPFRLLKLKQQIVEIPTKNLNGKRKFKSKCRRNWPVLERL